MQIKKHLVETSKGNLEYNISGSGHPAIVLINGGSGPIEGWMKILQEISEITSVFSYNRFGVAGSNKPKEPQDGITIVEDLREALSIVGLKPPYLLVGHSLGGLYSNLFARVYPKEVAGVVFLEASHPKDIRLNEYQGKMVKSINKMFTLLDSLSSHTKFNEVNFVKETISQINQIESFPEIPVHVITGGKGNPMMPEKARKAREAHQVELLSLSKNSKHIIAEKSGHFPQLTEPRVVIDTIKDAVQQINNQKYNL